MLNLLYLHKSKDFSCHFTVSYTSSSIKISQINFKESISFHPMISSFELDLCLVNIQNQNVCMMISCCTAKNLPSAFGESSFALKKNHLDRERIW